MTNLKTILGAMVWAAISGVLMLSALTPVNAEAVAATPTHVLP